MTFLCPQCNHGSSEIRWNQISNDVESHCNRCGVGTKVLSDKYKEIH